MNCDEIVSGLILEFRRGTLIMVVLAQLNKPMYGYSLVKELEGKGISIEGNTLYPLLRRLESQGLLKVNGKLRQRSQENIILSQKMGSWFIKN